MQSAPLSENASCTIASPIGALVIGARAEGVTSIHFEGRGPRPALPDTAAGGVVAPEVAAVLALARAELAAYFAGARRDFSVPCAPEGTAFQRRVWDALRLIPFGEVTSYGAIASRIGAPRSVRAVGAANGRNPIPIIVPCHRVVGSNGSLTGFGGGLPRKQWLLEHEGALPIGLLRS